MGYLVAGDTDLEITLRAMHTLVEKGADVIELGVPFSDPAAEGPTIQRGHERALAGHVTLLEVLALVAKFRLTDDITPLVLMGYANPMEWMGTALFSKRAAAAGVDAVLTVDLPPEESAGYTADFEREGLVNIFLIAPTTSDARVASICKAASGFIYYVSLKGVTGSDKLDVDEVRSRVALIRRHTQLPVCVGFGIKTPVAAGLVAPHADGVVIGSAIVEILGADQPAEVRLEQLGQLVADIRKAID